MQTKAPKISDFRDKIVLCKLVSTVDDELNRIYDIKTVREVWAVASVKSSNVDETDVGFRPELQYQFIVRNQDVYPCDCVKWKGKVLYLSKPYYPLNTKYIVLECTENENFPSAVS